MSLSYHSSGTPDPIHFSCQQDQLQLNWCQHNCLACLVASLSLEIFTFQSNIFQCFTVTMVGQHIFLFCFLPSVLFKLPVLHPRDINYCPFHSDCPFPLESKLSHYWGFLTSVLSFLGSVLSLEVIVFYIFSLSCLFELPPPLSVVSETKWHTTTQHLKTEFLFISLTRFGGILQLSFCYGKKLAICWS